MIPFIVKPVKRTRCPFKSCSAIVKQLGHHLKSGVHKLKPTDGNYKKAMRVGRAPTFQVITCNIEDNDDDDENDAPGANVSNDEIIGDDSDDDDDVYENDRALPCSSRKVAKNNDTHHNDTQMSDRNRHYDEDDKEDTDDDDVDSSQAGPSHGRRRMLPQNIKNELNAVFKTAITRKSIKVGEVRQKLEENSQLLTMLKQHYEHNNIEMIQKKVYDYVRGVFR